MKDQSIAEKFTQEEIGGDVFSPRRISNAEQRKANFQLSEARKKVQGRLTDRDRLTSRLLRFRLQLDDYLSGDDFKPEMTFANSLRTYILIIDKKRKVFAREIDIKESELSQLINRHRSPSEPIIVRLEIHSNNAIPADKWFRLLEKEKVNSLRNNKALRREQKAHVTHKLKVTLAG